MNDEEKIEEKEKTIEESLKDPMYVNYNMLLKLEEIKKILFSMHEMMRQKELKESKKTNTGEQRETVIP